MSISVFICPCVLNGGQAKELYRLSKLYNDDHIVLSNDIAACDLILATDIISYQVLRSILRQKKFKGHWGKVVVFGEMDYPPKQFPCIGPSVIDGGQPGAALPYYFLMKSMTQRFGSITIDVNSNRSLLFSFQGRICNQIRKQLIKLFGGEHTNNWLVTDTTNSFPIFKWKSVFDEKQVLQREAYLNMLANSKFALCPAGAGSSSIRIYEALCCGAVPVIISDHWKSPCGVDFDSAIVRIREDSIKNVPDILKSVEAELDDLQKQGKNLLPELIGEKALWSRLTDGLNSIYENIDMYRNVPFFKLYIYAYGSDIRRYIRQRKRDVIHMISK